MFKFDNEIDQKLYNRVVEKMKKNVNLNAASDGIRETVEIMIAIGAASAVTALAERDT